MSKETEKKETKTTALVITPNTLIPLGAVAGIISFCAWLTYISYTANANAKSIVELKKELKHKDTEIVKELREMNTRLSHIEGKLNGLRIKR